MFISHKSNVIQQIHQEEWQCRMMTKGLQKADYWAWINSITSGDPPVADYSGEAGYTIVECIDENISERLSQLKEYIFPKITGIIYNIKYYASKRDAEELKNPDGSSHDPKPVSYTHLTLPTILLV